MSELVSHHIAKDVEHRIGGEHDHANKDQLVDHSDNPTVVEPDSKTGLVQLVTYVSPNHGGREGLQEG